MATTEEQKKVYFFFSKGEDQLHKWTICTQTFDNKTMTSKYCIDTMKKNSYANTSINCGTLTYIVCTGPKGGLVCPADLSWWPKQHTRYTANFTQTQHVHTHGCIHTYNLQHMLLYLRTAHTGPLTTPTVHGEDRATWIRQDDYHNSYDMMTTTIPTLQTAHQAVKFTYSECQPTEHWLPAQSPKRCLQDSCKYLPPRMYHNSCTKIGTMSVLPHEKRTHATTTLSFPG